MHEPAFNPWIVIPVYDHERAIGGVVANVRASGAPVLLVDDGSHDACARVLDGLAQREGVFLLRQRNGGKGAAVMAGFREARARGATHALQIDADGQHDAGDVPAFLALAKENPEAVVSGVPRYDASVPKARLYGRYATHAWVWINTLSFAIQDSMCGLRVYPLAAALELIEREKIGVRMDFDTEILVRLHWRGVRIIERETRVTYPQDGVSHFDAWRDNLRISRMHARLCCGMLLRAPRLLARKLRGAGT